HLHPEYLRRGSRENGAENLDHAPRDCAAGGPTESLYTNIGLDSKHESGMPASVWNQSDFCTKEEIGKMKGGGQAKSERAASVARELKNEQVKAPRAASNILRKKPSTAERKGISDLSTSRGDALGAKKGEGKGEDQPAHWDSDETEDDYDSQEERERVKAVLAR